MNELELMALADLVGVGYRGLSTEQLRKRLISESYP